MKFTYFKIFSILSVIISLSSCSKTDLVNTEIATVIPKQGSSFTFTNVHYDTNGVETYRTCLLYTSDAADERSSVDLGGSRIIKKKKE